jgi:hypothetical protein
MVSGVDSVVADSVHLGRAQWRQKRVVEELLYLIEDREAEREVETWDLV